MGRGDDAPVEFELPIGALVSSAADALASGAQDDVSPPDEAPMAGDGGEDPVLAFHRTRDLFASGITCITVASDDRALGVIPDAFIPVSLRPPLVLVSVDDRATLPATMTEGTRLGISVLAEEQEAMAGRFLVGRGGTGAEPTVDVVRGTPLVGGALAHLIARVSRSYPGGDHVLFLARVEYVRCGGGRPLLVRGGHYVELSAPEGSILGALPPEMREKLLSAGEEHVFGEGDTVIRQGERGADAFVILSGRARVVRDGQEMARLGPGQFFGEVAMLDGRPRTADVVAESQLRCIALSRETIRRALRSEPDLAWRVLEVLAGRIRG